MENSCAFRAEFLATEGCPLTEGSVSEIVISTEDQIRKNRVFGLKCRYQKRLGNQG